MTGQRASIVDLMVSTITNLRIVTERFRCEKATKPELQDITRLLDTLADLLRLYTDKMPDEEPGGRHALRESPP